MAPDQASTTTARQAFLESGSPIARFVGHSLAVALGFAALAVVLFIPVLIVRALVALGDDDLSKLFGSFERVTLYGEIAFFATTLLIGAIELLVTEVIWAYKRVARALRF